MALLWSLRAQDGRIRLAYRREGVDAGEAMREVFLSAPAALELALGIIRLVNVLEPELTTTMLWRDAARAIANDE